MTTTVQADRPEGSFSLPPRRPERGPRAAVRALVRRVPPVVATYRAARRATTEMRMLAQGIRAERRLRKDPHAESRFAEQAIEVYEAPLAHGPDRPGLLTMLERSGLAYRDLGSAVYLPAQAGLSRAVGAAADAYPEGSGFLIARSSQADQWRDRLLAGVLLHAENVGPRVYDLIGLTGAVTVPALVLADPVTEPAAEPEREAVASAVRALAGAGLVVVDDAQWDQPENFRASDGGSAAFIRPDLLRAPDQGKLIDRALDGAREELHFGREAALRGRRYLYQSVPAARQAGRRDTTRRWDRIQELLGSEGVSVKGRPVLDVGCNAGLMLAAALADGARWGLGWDLPEVARHAQRVVGALGCTRVDLFGAELSADYDLVAEVPDHLHPALDDSLVLYLAIRHHVGFLKSLGTLPWRVMVYEGGETESVARLDEVLEDLRALCDFRVAAAVDFRDSETLSRPLAVLIREGRAPR